MPGSLTSWIIVGVILSNLASFYGGYLHGRHSENIEWKAKIEKERADAEFSARQQEQKWQGAVDGALKNYTISLSRITHQRDLAIAELRKRSERPAGMSEAPRIDCTGANGAELAGVNAEFLERYAATAAIQDEALATCYAVLDSTKN